MHVRRILFATDGSPAALQAADKLAFLVRNNQETTVTIVAALPPQPLIPNAPAPESEAERGLLLRQQAECAVERTARVFAKWGLPWSGRVVEGDCSCTAIAEAANEDLADIIAMSSHECVFPGAGAPPDVNLTDEVMQRSSVPVLVLPPDTSIRN